jgi:hypothetical protein
MTGHWNMVWNRSNYAGAFRNGNTQGATSGVVNDLNSIFSFNPTHKLGLMVGTTYNDNAFGALQQRFQESGGVLIPSLSTALRTFSVNSQANYSLFQRLSLYGRVNHYEQWAPGFQRGLTQFSGSGSYSYARPFLGAFTFSLGVVDTMTQQGNTGASLVGNLNYMRRIRSWEWGADFSYSQQIQTLYTVYTTSNYRYGASLKKRFRGLQWMGMFSGSQSGLTHFEGYSSRTESYSTNVLFSRFNVNGHYTTSSGTSVLTSSGLVELPPGVPPSVILLPVLYDATSYGGGASVRPFRRGVFSVSYNKAHSATAAFTRNTGFDSTIFNARFTYRLRKMNLEANFTRFEQNISTGTLPAMINSYYIRFSRWFNIF